MALLRRFLRNDTGATAIEYALVASLMAAAIILGFGSAADALKYLFSDNNSKLVQALGNGN
ncbi:MULTISPECIES: Flp family type IVb pilin [Phyllobacteriaceae]|jgi:pilus assembly protein Flp/PilA|uniref:Pilus assembly protein PilA n=1 Tax=Mesorhizobium hungaricum TaxID=1566387 RepID=A0A1C2DG43_9HYPH|nr:MULTISPECIES: Flp family type IVb pilin [Mesorhizobium]MBN9232180.1 Flp family type IVb pilin [Mesorhizobium sp.]MDQ0329775.1 pilus assembly protein Flp/PilA [Mesorhizobium sp. YL-MeA3-2017]OCX13635.1 pilus assembly protein PilA [Mesorhizobium hungaricum]